MRYILGSGGRSYMVGWGINPPSHVPDPAASCPAAVQPCAAPKASSQQYASPDPDPHALSGALVSGPSAGYVTSDRPHVTPAIPNALHGCTAGFAHRLGSQWKSYDDQQMLMMSVVPAQYHLLP